MDRIAVVSINRRKLNLIEQSLAESGDRTAKLGFYSPEELIAKLYDWAGDDPEGGNIERGKLRKNKISLTAGQLSENERKQREREMLKHIAEAMKRK